MIEGFDFSYKDGDSYTGDLDSDVWRFQSILGYCLICVFALMQAMPVASIEEVETQNTENNYAQPVNVYKTQFEEQTKQLKSLGERLRYLENLNQELTNAQSSHLSEAKNLRETLKQAELSKLASEKAAEQLLQKLKQSQEKEFTKKNLLLAAENNLSHKKISSQTKPSKPEDSAKLQELTVQFKSDDALLNLMSDAKVQIFTQTKTRYWEVKTNRVRVITEWPNEQMIELEKSTVPLSLKKLLAGTEAKWFVAMNEELQKSIKGYISKYQTGRILINSIGQISFEQN